MMSDVMMQLGGYQFGVSTAAYQSFKQSNAYRWPSQERVGKSAALQFTGPGGASITLSGSVFPAWKGGTGQLEEMRALAATGRPHLLVDGLGNIHGRWVIESVEEDQSTFARAGVPRKQSFTLQLRKFDDGASLQNQ